MKSAWRGLPLALSLLASGHSGRAEAPPAPVAAKLDSPPAPGEVRKEMNELLRADAQAVAAANAPQPGPARLHGGTAVQLDPYIVKARKTPTVAIPPFQTRLDRFLETGEVLLHAGKNTNLLFSVGGENGRSGSGRAELALHLSW